MLEITWYEKAYWRIKDFPRAFTEWFCWNCPWLAQLWYAHHNARVILDFEERMSGLLCEYTSTMSKPYYTLEAMIGEIDTYIDKRCYEAAEEVREEFEPENEQEVN